VLPKNLKKEREKGRKKKKRQDKKAGHGAACL
jgi:hypothetical protein